jgi:hypothetical protein
MVGNSVTLSNWKDIWLNEGFATYASWFWLERQGGEEALLAEIQETSDWLDGDVQVPCAVPGADLLFNTNVKRTGALTLHALRLKVAMTLSLTLCANGTNVIIWPTRLLADFIALAEEIGGVDLSAFFDEWLQGRSGCLNCRYEPGIPSYSDD